MHVMESGNARQIKQLRQSLEEKVRTLSKLDDELLELVPDEQLDEEVQQADEIRERISLAVISLDDELEAVLSPESIRANTSPSRSSVASGEDPGVIPEATETTVRTTTDDPAGPPTDGVLPPAVEGAPPDADLPPAAVTPTPMVSLTSTGIGPVTTVSTSRTIASTSVTFSGFPTMTLPAVPHPMTVPPMLPHIVPHPTPVAYGVTPQVKLPKLSIKKFNGDLTRWVTFWDAFNSSIHTNPTLSSVDKFNYLSSLLESSAAEAIAGLALTAANYDEAIATLKKRFGNPQHIVNRHMEALLNTTAISLHSDVRGLRRLCDSVEAHIRGLRALGIFVSAYGGMLSSILVNKLPPEIRLIVSREIAAGSWDLDKVMSIVEREVEARKHGLQPPNHKDRCQLLQHSS